MLILTLRLVFLYGMSSSCLHSSILLNFVFHGSFGVLGRGAGRSRLCNTAPHSGVCIPYFSKAGWYFLATGWYF